MAVSISKFATLTLLLLTAELRCGVHAVDYGNHISVSNGQTSGEAYFQMINDFDRLPVESSGQIGSLAHGAAGDRRSVVECGGVYKRLQSEIRSPEYPDAGYQPNLHCEYTFKSPFVCSNQYHFQFLDFALEPSRNCTKDRVVIGEEEILCGTVIGSKLYDAPGGLLRMKFVSDAWRSERGFRILVTRQPCGDDNDAEESSTAYTVFSTIQVADETEPSVEESTTMSAPASDEKVLSSRQDIPPEFNPGGNGYLPPVTVPPAAYPPTGYPPATYPPQAYPCPVPPCLYPPWGCTPPNYPPFPALPPRPVHCDPRYQSCPPTYPSYPLYPQQPPQYPGCVPNQGCIPGQVPQYPQYPTYPGYPSTTGTEGTNSIGGPPPGYEPVKTEMGAEFPEPTTERTPEPPESQVSFVPGPGHACCRNTFSQRRFYLSSANFPSQYTNNQDCVVQIQRYSPATCRLVVNFKFFALGNDQVPACPGGFVEIDGRRICGCHTGQTYRTSDFGPYQHKTIRVHTDAGRFPVVQGFVLEVFQEECSPRVPLKRSDDTDRLVQRHVQWPPAARNGLDYEMVRVEGKQLRGPLKAIRTTNTTTTQETTHQYYYYNGDDAQPVQLAREPLPVGAETLLRPVHYYPGSDYGEKFAQPIAAQQQSANRCVFTTADWLRLKLDWLWIFKPVCLA
ncbi:uncharacterized protein LOC131208104 [Anopheles bellator]|uniref:uncharacterized protein LOC131208104 n=1 Tax=Anopheles bellator TaxID=139047 RepID=UPI002648D33D|nr:uncharacterized protein LOC131208104 [Anopheles bellator]